MKWYIGWTKNKKRYDVFSSNSRPSREVFGKTYINITGPYSSATQAYTDALKFGKGSTAVRILNPIKEKGVRSSGIVEIYSDLEAIEATKGRNSLWPKGKFRHDFTKKGTKVLGLSDGSLLIVNPKHKLWKKFNY